MNSPPMFELLASDEEDSVQIDYFQIVENSLKDEDDLATQPIFLLGLESQLSLTSNSLPTSQVLKAPPKPGGVPNFQIPSSLPLKKRPNPRVTRSSASHKKKSGGTKGTSSQKPTKAKIVRQIKRKTFNCRLNGKWHVISRKDIDILDMIGTNLDRISKIARQKGPLGSMRALTLELAQVETILDKLKGNELEETVPEDLWNEMLQTVYHTFHETQTLVTLCKTEPPERFADWNENLTQNWPPSTQNVEEDDNFIPPTPRTAAKSKTSTAARQSSQKRRGKDQQGGPEVATSQPNNHSEKSQPESQHFATPKRTKLAKTPISSQPKQSTSRVVEKINTQVAKPSQRCENPTVSGVSDQIQNLSAANNGRESPNLGRIMNSQKSQDDDILQILEVSTTNAAAQSKTQNGNIDLQSSPNILVESQFPNLTRLADQIPPNIVQQNVNQIPASAECANDPFHVGRNSLSVGSQMTGEPNVIYETQLLESNSQMDRSGQFESPATHVSKAVNSGTDPTNPPIDKNTQSEVNATQITASNQFISSASISASLNHPRPGGTFVGLATSSQMDPPSQSIAESSSAHFRYPGVLNSSLAGLIKSGILKPKTDIRMFIGKNTYTGTVGEAGNIQMNGLFFPTVNRWLLAVTGRTLGKWPISDRRLFRLEYDGHDLADLINKRPRDCAETQPLAVPIHPVPNQQEVRNLACRITKILIHPPEESHRSCQCEEDMWDSDKPLAYRLLSEVTNW